MPSRLSSLLVRDGLVGVKRMEKAFQRQVIYGGSLDTNLLEMNLVPEERLTQYLALASGLPPADPAETSVFDHAAVSRLPRELAELHRTAPLLLHDEGLRVLVCAPVDLSLLEDLADTLDLALQPLIVPEYRWHCVFARAYGETVPPRFAVIERNAELTAAAAPVGHPATVIVATPDTRATEVTQAQPDEFDDFDDLDRDHVVIDIRNANPADAAALLSPAGYNERTARMMSTAPHDEGDEPPVNVVAAEDEARRRAAEWINQQVTTNFAKQEHVDEQATESFDKSPPTNPGLDGLDGINVTTRIRRTRPRGVPVLIANAKTATPPKAVVIKPDRSQADILLSASARQALAESKLLSSRESPMTPVVARSRLANATDRDQVFELLLRAVRHHFRWAGIFTILGRSTIGRRAMMQLDSERDDNRSDIAHVAIPLDPVSAFHRAANDRAPFAGPLASHNAIVDSLWEQLGSDEAPRGIVVPIVLKDRVVALLVGHHSTRPGPVHDDAELASQLADIAPLAIAAAEALGRIIVEKKPDHGHEAARPAPTAHSIAAEIAAVAPPQTRQARDTVQMPMQSASRPAVQPEPTDRPIDDLLDIIEQMDHDVTSLAQSEQFDDAMDELLSRATDVIPRLSIRFPGRLKIDRYRVSGRPLHPEQYGGLLDLVVQLGEPVVPMLLEKLGSPSRDIRFYATVCVGAIRPVSAIPSLVERIFDGDFGVRSSAVEALTGYPLRELDSALSRARRALHDEDGARVLAAANAIADLGDIAAIPELLAVVSQTDRRGDHVRRALVKLTRQDYEKSERKWQRWWEHNVSRHRIEWLIDALDHKDEAIRQGAIDDLRQITGETFGYLFDLDKHERTAAISRWASWWATTGRARFTSPSPGTATK